MSERYHLTEMMRRRALNGERRATQLEQGARVAEHRLEIEQRDNRALQAQVTRLRLKREVPQ